MLHFVVWLAPVKTVVNPVSYFTEVIAGKDTLFFQAPQSFAEVHRYDVNLKESLTLQKA